MGQVGKDRNIQEENVKEVQPGKRCRGSPCRGPGLAEQGLTGRGRESEEAWSEIQRPKVPVGRVKASKQQP